MLRHHSYLTKPNCPHRFGQAILRGDIVEDDDWAEKVEVQDEVEALRRVLHRREIRDRTPYIPENFFPWFLPFQ